MTRAEIMQVYDLLSVEEVALLIGIGGTLPKSVWSRQRRMMEAVKLIRSDEAYETGEKFALAVRAYVVAAGI